MSIGMNPFACCRQRSSLIGGFTLIEVLIATSLLALLMLVLAGALSGMGQTETRIEQRVDEADDYRLSTDFLRQVMSQASPRQYAILQLDNFPQLPFFLAAPDSLQWVGIMPARFDLGGRHYLRLALENGQLVLRFAPWTGEPGFGQWQQASALSLAQPVRALEFSYLNPLDGSWSDVWPPAGLDRRQVPVNLLPAAVRLDVDGLKPPWPPLIVRLRAAMATDPVMSSGADLGGGG